MIQLQTPILYSDELDCLADVLPLVIGDEVRQVIDMPVCNQQPVGSVKPAVGRFLRSSNGSLLKHPNSHYDKIEHLSYYSEAGPEDITVTFSQRVSKVMVRIEGDAITFASQRFNSDYSIVFWTKVNTNGCWVLDFVGTTMYWRYGPMTGTQWMHLYGFY